jgi:hypothetical protein
MGPRRNPRTLFLYKRGAKLTESDKSGSLVEYRRLPVSSLFVPHDYQRELKPRWVEIRVPKFDEESLGTLTVSASTNGKYHVIDGQHRLALIREAAAGGGEVPTSVWCEVRQMPSRESEANLFVRRNDAQPVPPLDKFRARVIAGEPQANAIKDIMKRLDVQVGYQTASIDSTSYACVSSIEAIYITDQLEAVIRIIEESWATRLGKLARTQLLVDGVGLFHNTYRKFSEYNIDRAIQEFSKIEKLSALVTQAKNNAVASKTRPKYQFAMLLLPRYNRLLRNKLPINDLIENY